MQIKKVYIQRHDLQLRAPYTIAYETIDQAVNFSMRMETSSGLSGWGLAAPDPVVTGEHPDKVEDLLHSSVAPFLTGKDATRPAKILEELRNHLSTPGTSVPAMVDIALHDLLARRAGLPLFRLMGGYREKIPTSITIGILSVQDTLEQAREFVSAGFSILKIKGGLELEADIEKMLRLREEFGEQIRLRFDGNQGYSPREAIHFVNATRSAEVEIFEQPTKQGAEEMLGAVTAATHIPVMADESIRNLADTFRLASNDRIDMVNIKVQKVGGLQEAIHINSVARAAGLECMVGCIDECGLGIAAGLHLALSRPNIEFADLDGHLDFTEEPFPGLFHLEKGVLIPIPDSIGLGPIR